VVDRARLESVRKGKLYRGFEPLSALFTRQPLSELPVASQRSFQHAEGCARGAKREGGPPGHATARVIQLLEKESSLASTKIQRSVTSEVQERSGLCSIGSRDGRILPTAAKRFPGRLI
jgi:hypothetical protein